MARRGRTVLAVAGLLLVPATAGCVDASAPVPGLDLVAEDSPGPGASTGAASDPAVPGTASPGGSPAPAGTVSPTDPAAYAARVVAATNRARVDAGLTELAESACARDAAVPRAAALVGTPGLDHAPMDDVLGACAPRTVAAENLSRAAATPDDVVTAWLGSSGHRENLLSPSLTELGVACLRDGDAMLCSQIFLGP